MKKDITMPKLTPDMKTGILCAWMKQPGEDVKKGDVLFEIETEKVVNQVESTVNGIMGQLSAEEGDEIEVGAKIAEIEESV